MSLHRRDKMSYRSSNKTYVLGDSTLSQASFIEDKLKSVNGAAGARRSDYKSTSVLLCAKCSTVLGDSLGVCGADSGVDVKAIICSKVTEDVLVQNELKISLEGPLAACAYNSLCCSTCHRQVGVRLQSTPPHLSALRSLFILHKDSMNCYMLKSGTVVSAASVSFEQRTFGKRLVKLKQELDTQMNKLIHLKETLVELRTNKMDL
ncbi:protein Mis18-beta [Denticeps clupeoides]|uniref:protein Mis18-beta n=1 Tax=Denticeps clupeoides TaxID=299321 RepID=UPI0010A3E7FC|nr:protein Mis18-beta [Denticeps clupeoides]